MTKSQLPAQTSRPPIVAVLGHVDHGKTSLLDAIRKTNVTESEHGGITQHIGAYQITVAPKDTKETPKLITFIDTPGHEAFTKMRSRGTQVSDIAILVVAATEGIKPQTEESIKFIKAAGIPMIVALTKTDLSDANIERVKQQLTKYDVLVESFGGDVVAVGVSAKTGAGIPQLLESILLVAEIKELKGESNVPFSGVVIEVKLDKGRGALATVIVKNGSLKNGQTIYAEDVVARVRAMHDAQGQIITTAHPSMPVEVMGWERLPLVGAAVYAQKTAAEMVATKFQPKPFALPPLETRKKLKLILKTDVGGSLEAIRESLSPDIEIIHAATGEITESDILLAKSTGSVIIGFNLRTSGKITKLAQTEKVRIKSYTIIYQLLEEITEVTELLNKPEAAEEILGEATIQAEFEFDDIKVAGCKIDRGRISRGDTIKLMRGSDEIIRTRIKSMRHGKTDIAKAESPQECGIIFDKKLDFKITDRIIAFKEPELLA